MKITRRKFLLATPLVAGALLQLKGSVFASSAVKSDPLLAMTVETFTPLLHTDFVFRDGTGKAVTLVLSRVMDETPPGSKGALSGVSSYTLGFTGPVRDRLVEQIYTVEHFSLGTFELSITPGSASRRSVPYTAAICRVAR